MRAAVAGAGSGLLPRPLPRARPRPLPPAQRWSNDAGGADGVAGSGESGAGPRRGALAPRSPDGGLRSSARRRVSATCGVASRLSASADGEAEAGPSARVGRPPATAAHDRRPGAVAQGPLGPVALGLEATQAAGAARGTRAPALACAGPAAPVATPAEPAAAGAGVVLSVPGLSGPAPGEFAPEGAVPLAGSGESGAGPRRDTLASGAPSDGRGPKGGRFAAAAGAAVGAAC